MKGGYADERHERAASLMPDANIRFTEITYQRNDLQKSLILGDDSFDIFCFDAQDVNTKSLMEKGYAVPLEGEIINQHMARLYPRLAQMASGAERSNLMAQAQAYQDTFDEILEKQRYLVSAEILNEYRHLMQDVVILDADYALLMQANAPAILRRALAGQISPQAAAQEADGRIALMRQEQE